MQPRLALISLYNSSQSQSHYPTMVFWLLELVVVSSHPASSCVDGGYCLSVLSCDTPVSVRLECMPECMVWSKYMLNFIFSVRVYSFSSFNFVHMCVLIQFFILQTFVPSELFLLRVQNRHIKRVVFKRGKKKARQWRCSPLMPALRKGRQRQADF